MTNMTVLILGLVLFLGIHSVRVVADGTRSAFIAKRGANAWKGLYTLLSLAGFALLVWGYGLARQQPTVLWAAPPVWTRHVAALLTLIAWRLPLMRELKALPVPERESEWLGVEAEVRSL